MEFVFLFGCRCWFLSAELLRPTSKAFAYNGMEYVCHFEEIGSRRCLCVFKVYELNCFLPVLGNSFLVA